MGLAGHSVFNNYQELYNEVLKLGVLAVKTTGNLLFDVPVSVHGDSATPITTNLAIDPTNAIEGATVEVIWQGSVNPNITGVPALDILNIGETITTQGTYSIFISYTGGKYKVNIQSPVAYVGDGDGLGDPDDPPTNTPLAPTNLAYTSTGQDSVNLTWTKSVGATSYKAYLTNGTELATFGDVATGDLTGLADNTYNVVVRAINANGESGNSNTVVFGIGVSLNPPQAPSLSLTEYTIGVANPPLAPSLGLTEITV